MNPIERVTNEGCFHPLIEAGSLSHVWIGESRPSKGAIADFVIKTFRHTTNDQIAFSPEFTTCNACNRTSTGPVRRRAPTAARPMWTASRGSPGYFTKVSSWNKGKLGELKERYRNTDSFNGGSHEDGHDLYERQLSALSRS